jgi:integrase
MKMPKEQIIKTDLPNLYYKLNSKNQKVYIAYAYNGKRRHKKVLTTNIDESMLMLIEFKKEIKLLKKQITFKELFDEYMEIVARPFQTPREVKTKESRYKTDLFRLEKKYVATLKYSDLQEIINKALDRGVAPKTAKNIKQLLQVVMNFALKQLYITHNCATDIIIPKYDNKQNLKINLEQAKELVQNIYSLDNENARAIMVFGLHGRRLGEILNLTWNQIDLELAQYHLPWQKNKAKKNLTFSMSDWLKNILQDKKDKAVKDDMYYPENYVFYNPQTLTKYVDVQRQFKKVKRLSGIPNSDFRFHDFRHLIGTYAIQILEKPIEKVSHALGHSTITTTQIYVTRDKDTARDITSGFLNVFFNDIKGLK